jgi:adhesin transport system membrane fusion protein
VIPFGEIQIVQNLEGGIISEILVKEGELVYKDQLLLRIDDTRFSSSFKENMLRAQALKAKNLRLEAEVNNLDFNPSEVPGIDIRIIMDEVNLFNSRRNELNSSIAILNEEKQHIQQEISELLATNKAVERGLALATEELNMKRPLVEKGTLPRVEILQIERQAADLEGRLEINKHTLPKLNTSISGIARKIEERQAQYKTRALTELNENKGELARLEEGILALEDQVRRTEVKSPVDGIIKQIKVNTIGGVIQPGMDLVEIVPADNSLVIEAEVRPQDIAFLHPGQKAIIKLTAYDFAIYGGLEASLEHISADTIINDANERMYKIRLRTEKTHLEAPKGPLPIIAGMTAEVDILTGKKTIMNYILKPLRRAQERAMRER